MDGPHLSGFPMRPEEQKRRLPLTGKVPTRVRHSGYLYDGDEFVVILLREMSEAGEFFRKQSEVVEGYDPVLVDVEKTVKSPHLPLPERGVSLRRN